MIRRLRAWRRARADRRTATPCPACSALVPARLHDDHLDGHWADAQAMHRLAEQTAAAAPPVRPARPHPRRNGGPT